jgi:hypothetical protein
VETEAAPSLAVLDNAVERVADVQHTEGLQDHSNR